ncbi:MAG: hypothetical protein COU63_00375 [Candidatus Pacebacteria bacterium CG10_big_fil_rev_8_21_14_0_10_36_11]|nr:hypothetical protein [Candidatus Pacearchaeota archaeon]OIP74210.1 MAG: hypothetical protein AUK08_03125 [Candidatus Pacebacteria bacterium CG2_30_36_39]PIR65113.1 MAG: hypothetical protein COU63_00375 [Candidatus Pacebacteria bacterium CG10_big_fil_rev_8_21_14_0_10_36_11]PJC42668.1 MAG: hypothetical protein CO040_03265 [Candidatus Pacebacteria bacterium CG_4_9_14_0_2_um_filter_36_8]
MQEELSPLSPLELCINLVNAKIGHYRRAKFLSSRNLPQLFNEIVIEARKHSAVWDQYVSYTKSHSGRDKELIELVNSVSNRL